METLYPEIRWVKDIKKIHVQVFIFENKRKWSYKTRVSYKNFFEKLVVMTGFVYHSKLDFSGIDYGLNEPRKSVKNHPMKTDDFIKLTEACFSSKSNASKLPLLTATIGARMEEVASIKPEDIDLVNNRVNLTNCKNGRNRSVPIKEDFKFLWKYSKEKAQILGFPTILNGIKTDTVRKFLNSMKKKADLKNYPYESNHAIRKMYAQRRFSEELLKGNSVEDSWINVQKELGHGSKARKELFKTYIGTDLKQFEKNYRQFHEPIISEEEVNRQVEFIKSFEERLSEIA